MCFPVKISKFYKKPPFLFWRTSANDCFWKAFLILGGVRRAVGKDLQVEFDASQSFDPDAGEWEGELHYKWYCRRKDEEFHERFELIPPKAPDAGCFRNGRYLLSEGYGGFQVVSEDQSIIIVSFTAKNSPVLGFLWPNFLLLGQDPWILSLWFFFFFLFFVVWLTDEGCVVLIPARTIVRDPHHRESPIRFEQDLNLRRTWVPVLLNEVVQ